MNDRRRRRRGPSRWCELVPTAGFAVPRQAQSAEITPFVMFVASDRASFATGSELVVDGGFALGPVQ